MLTYPIGFNAASAAILTYLMNTMGLSSIGEPTYTGPSSHWAPDWEGTLRDFGGAVNSNAVAIPPIVGARLTDGVIYDDDGSGNDLQPSVIDQGIKSYLFHDAHQVDTAYSLGDKISAVASDGIKRWYECTTAGTSDASAPTFPTSGTVADGTAVWTYGGYHTLVGPLIEGARTNLLTYSEQFDNVVWAKNGVTVIANATTAPDGNATADKVYPSAASRVMSQTTTKVESSLPYTAQIRYKDELWGKHLAFRIGSSVSNCVQQWLDVANNTLGTGNTGGTGFTLGDVSISSPDAEGFRTLDISLTSDALSSLNIYIYFVDDDASFTTTLSDTDGIYLWGADLKVGNFLDSYIPTAATTVTRSAGVLSYPTEGIIRDQNCAVWGKVVPSGAGQNNARLLSTYNTATAASTAVSYFSGNLRLQKTGISGNPIITSAYSPAEGTPFEYQAAWTDQGMILRVKEDGGSWSAWATHVNAAAAPIATTFEIGSLDGANHFFGNYPFLRTLFLPTKASLAEYQTYVADEENW